jgi:hypothetical protein
MKKYIKSIILLALGVMLAFNSSCETTELNLLDDPNALSSSAGDPDKLLDGVQISFGDAIHYLGEPAAEVTRLKYMFGRNYQNAYSAAFFDSDWSTMYRRILKNIRTLTPIAENAGFTKHIGISQVLEAYSIVTLVDMFGDIPYSEALDGANLNPKLDPGQEVYAKAEELLDAAIVNFNTDAPANPKNDFYYQGDWSKWIRLANTIKMKMYIQTRLVDNSAITKFNAIVNSGNYIQSGDDFEFNWGVSATNPDSRHPAFRNNYTPSGVEAGYQSNWLLNTMRNEKTVIDPRIRYYFYRQVNDVPISEQDLRCSVEPIPPHYAANNQIYCIIDNNDGYWGRDHGNAEGIPNDRQKRTAVGLYPAGGRFDGNNFVAIGGAAAPNFGARGYGITPILLASTVDFWRAEATFFGGSGDARQLMLDGIQKSFNKVRGFISRDPSANLSFVPPLSDDAAYLANVGTLYDNAPGNSGKLNRIIKEMFITLFGNGIDSYNAYRRTGFPNDLQLNIEPDPGGFIRSFLYPASETNTNSNIDQKSSVRVRVFWDNNPETGFPSSN